MILWIVGMMGSGKTTVGRIVASRLGVDFHDTDGLVQEQAAMPVARIWSERGEDSFRRIEANVVKVLADRGPAVVATGGGAVLDQISRQLMSSSGQVVWLDCSSEVLADRLEGSSGRPLLELATGGLDSTIEEILASRRPIYEDLADTIIDVSDAEPDEIADRIEGLWRS